MPGWRSEPLLLMNLAGRCAGIGGIVCASGSEGAIAVGTPTERSGARSHAVGMDAEAPKSWKSEGGIAGSIIDVDD
jgi:hypothetical protein